MDNLCEKCEEVEIEVTCSCGAKFCERCFTKKHLTRNPTHRKDGNRKADEAWNWITGKISGLKSLADQFREDEDAKWFGLHSELTRKGDRITSIVETERLADMMSASLDWKRDSPRRQFPSIASFVGETGAGKSTLVRSLIYHSEKSKQFNPLEAPVSGSTSGSSTMSTTGEVNLYLDPTTFGTESPIFYADCEGIMGSSDPVASSHQNLWTKDGRRHTIAAKDGKHMDRRTAVRSLYPRFLYIFSDVVCYVTGNQRTWADSAVRLLEWSLAGAQSSINQHALPALIIVLNAPRLDNQAWVTGDPEAATNDFFAAIAGEISKSNFISDLAKKYDCQHMRELFSRSYSSVYVHYIPIKGYESCGSTETVVQQTVKLGHRIRSDAKRVQSARASAWTRFDTKQLSVLVDSAFEHLVSRKDEPFDFGQCRGRLSIPKSTEEHFSEILGHCLRGGTAEKFQATGKVLASSLLRHRIHEDRTDSGAPLIPSVVFNKEIRDLCGRAVSQFLDKTAQCAFINPADGQRCVNTKMGHAQGHQNAMGRLLQAGQFVSDEFDSQAFLTTVETAVNLVMCEIDIQAPSSRRDWRRYAAQAHRENLTQLRSVDGFPWMKPGGKTENDFGRNARVCYGCFFGRPEYRLPCDHAICAACVEDFDDTPKTAKYPGLFAHESCPICAATGTGWPHRMRVKPDLAGVRVLSLDGGGVRGIVELVVLRQLEQQIGLGIPLGRFFDFIIGTSAGGIIALGLGVQDRTVDDCLARFRVFARTGLKKKILNKTKLVRWAGRFIRSSIYRTKELEQALYNAFSPTASQGLFGLRNSCRVAVTTTVHKELKLITNYNRGDGEKYLNSSIRIWNAARCTSAAPMYFERAYHAGQECWDGGLKANNPIQLAMTESQSVWGSDVDFDLLLSLGSGHASRMQKQHTAHIGHSWVADLLKTLLSTMDGEATWAMFCPEKRIRDRTVRLNVEFDSEVQPELDDVGNIPTMESAAEKHRFVNNPHGVFRISALSPLDGNVPGQMVPCLAARLRAGMFFFEMEYMEQKKGVVSFRGCICCRLAPDEDGFAALMDRTQGFIVAGEFLKFVKPPVGSENTPFKFPIVFHQPPTSTKPVRIDVNFGEDYQVGISGFPTTVKSLLDHGKMHSEYLKVSRDDFRQPVELEGSPVDIPRAVYDTAEADDKRPPPPYTVTVEECEVDGY